MDREPRPGVCSQKGARDRLIRWSQSKPEWELGYLDECWWSRINEPAQHAWSEPDQPLHLKSKAVAAGERKALACYGIWLPQSEEMVLRFVEGRPVSAVTVGFLEWLTAARYQAGKRVLFLVWDNASWHVSAAVRAWIKEHNRKVRTGTKQSVRLVVCQLPIKSPWLNPIEPKWLHGKRAVGESGSVLDEIELMTRILLHFDCPAYPLLSTAVP